jgi:surface protein
MAHDVYNSWDKSEYSLKAEKWKKMIEIARTNYPPFHEEWSFGQYFLKEKGWDYELRDDEMKHIVDEWRNSLDYKAFFKRKQIDHFMSTHGYKGSAYTRFCEKLDKREDQPWNDFVLSCISTPGFVDVDTKERMKAEVQRLGFKDRDDFEEFWIRTETQSTSPTSKPTVVPLLQADPKLIRTDADIHTAVDEWCNDRSAALNKYGHISEWDTSSVTSMTALFRSKKDFIDDISKWDVSKVTSMFYMFQGASSFNQPLNSWDVSKVTNMEWMFMDASSFNQPLASWDVKSVGSMNGMFYGASSFNQPLASWDVKSVGSMTGMFGVASSFNQPLDSWDVSKVTNMNGMFAGASSFNRPLDSWDVSKVTNMDHMFWKASSFNQPLVSWDVSKVTSMSSMFNGASSFNQCLRSWSNRISGSCDTCLSLVNQYTSYC